MQGKGLIRFFAGALAIICLYQLSFTWLSSSVEKDAKIYAKKEINPLFSSAHLDTLFKDDPGARRSYVDSLNIIIKKRERAYLDSIADEVILDLGIIDFTYKICKERELNLGLDLKGGMSVTLQVSVNDLIKSLSNYNTTPVFLEAIALAQKKEANSQQDFVTLFGESFNEIAPEAKLAVIFSTRENKEKINYNSTNEEVLEVIREEAKNAISRTFNILRTRIDKFGVSQPNITLQKGVGRIIIELPGVDDPVRVRKLLQSSARLEFWETYDNTEIVNYMIKANNVLSAKYNPTDTSVLSSDSLSLLDGGSDVNANDTTAVKADTNSLLSLIGGGKDGLSDTGLLGGTSDEIKKRTLFDVMTPAIQQDAAGNQVASRGPVAGYTRGNDTVKVNRFLAMDEVKAVFPRNIRFIWGAKPVSDDNPIYALYAIKTRSNSMKAPLEGDVIDNAQQDFDEQGNANIDMSMNSEGAKIWKRMTAEAVRNPDNKQSIAIVLDNYVYSAPVVQQEISGGRSQISGRFTVNEAKDLANILKAGKLPAPARIIEEEIVGPSLGKESINSGLQSLLFGLSLVLLFMVFYYSSSGIIANLALLVNLFFVIGILASLGYTLTLPGIAGLVLTIGISVDANVIIYERIREELLKGKGMRLAIVDGYKNSYSAIIDANVTTILTGIILAYFGSGAILGFATVLIIGIVCSLFTAVLLTQIAYKWLINKDKPIYFATKLTKGAFSKLNIDFFSKRKIAYLFSSIIIIGGIVSMIYKGFELGVDFKGGRSYIIRFEEPVNTKEVRDALKKVMKVQPLIRTFGEANQVKITTSYLIDDKTQRADSIVEVKLYESVKSIIGDQVTYKQFNDNYKMSSQKVGPTIADDIKRGAILATIFSLLGIFLYILIRFRKWQYGMGAIAALFHDVMIVLSVYSLLSGIVPFSLEIDQAFIAAILTIIGYSINDTVVIFDRLREFFSLHPNQDMKPVANQAVNKTMSRTLITSLTTLLVVIILFIFGGEVIRGFSFALLVGIISGTYSSIFIAMPVMVDLSKEEQLK